MKKRANDGAFFTVRLRKRRTVAFSPLRMTRSRIVGKNNTAPQSIISNCRLTNPPKYVMIDNAKQTE